MSIIQDYLDKCKYRPLTTKNHCDNQDWESNLDAIPITQLETENHKPWLYFHIQHSDNHTYLECEVYIDSCEYTSIQCFHSPKDILSWEIQIPEIFPYNSIKFKKSKDGISFISNLNNEIHTV